MTDSVEIEAVEAPDDPVEVVENVESEPAGEPVEVLGDAGKKALEVERERRKAAEATARELAESAAARERADAVAALSDEHGMTPEQSAFITGDSPDEMAESAKALVAAFLRPSTARKPPRSSLLTPHSDRFIDENRRDPAAMADAIRRRDTL